MDAFFASVEQLDRPELRGRPVLVGGSARRGVVAAASYEARHFHVHSAMPMAEAMRRCPQAIVVAPRSSRYSEISGQVFEIFHRFTPLVEGLSLDEAFLDVSASLRLFGDGESIARAIKRAIWDEVQLHASAGVAPCKFVAKIASDMNKPRGLCVVQENVAEFLAPLPIERMWGVGRKAAERLRAAGFDTLGDLATSQRERLHALLGQPAARISALARGEDDRAVIPDRDAKSVGSETTFEDDLTGRAELARELLTHAARVASRLTEEGLGCGVVRVKLKYADFQLCTRQRTLRTPVADTDSIAETARSLLDEFPRRACGVRLVGVSATDLKPTPEQLSLFSDPARQRRETLEKLSLNLNRRFGDAGVKRATLLGARKRPRSRPRP